MFKLYKDFKLFLLWKNTPYRDFAQIHELCMLAARRCAHDLDHASGEIFYTSGDKEESSKFFHDRASMWREVFYPIENQKRYRHELHNKISQLENCQEKLCEILAKHNVPLIEYERYSPNEGIPF